MDYYINEVFFAQTVFKINFAFYLYYPSIHFKLLEHRLEHCSHALSNIGESSSPEQVDGLL